MAFRLRFPDTILNAAGILCLLLFSFLPLSAQNHTGAPIELQYADSLVGTKLSINENIREFMGHVRFRQGDVYVNCNFARQFLNENRVELEGNVSVRQKSLTLTAPRINYNGNTYIAEANGGVKIVDKETILTANEGQYSTKTKIADFRGKVRIDDDSATITSDFITHSRITRESSAFGKVKIVGKFTNSVLRGDTVLNYPATNHSIAKGNPVLFQIDTVKSSAKADTTGLPEGGEPTDSINNFAGGLKFDTLAVSCDIMEAYREKANERYLFHGNTEITRGDVAAKSSEAGYFKSEERMELVGTPVVWYDSTQLHSDSVSIYLPDKKLKMIHAMRNAIALSRNDTTDLRRINQIAGDEIHINFEKDSIKSITGYGAAQSLYYMNSDQGGEGLSKSAADTIIVNFSEGKPSEIFWLKGIPGEFYPETQVADKPESYYLQRFIWIEKRPEKRRD